MLYDFIINKIIMYVTIYKAMEVHLRLQGLPHCQKEATIHCTICKSFVLLVLNCNV